MQTHWNALVTPLLPDTALRDDTYRQLESAYSGPGRHYHNLTHIRALLDTVDQHAALVHDRAVVELAIWFHDAVYDYRSAENEIRSAALARQFLAHTTLSPEQQARVAYLIECTARHTARHAPAWISSSMPTCKSWAHPQPGTPNTLSKSGRSTASSPVSSTAAAAARCWSSC